MPEEDEEEGHFGNDEPSTMVVGRDDTRHAELLTAARAQRAMPKPEPAGSTPVAKPSLHEESGAKVPGRSIAGTVAGTVDAAEPPARSRFPLALVLALVVALAIVALALYR